MAEDGKKIDNIEARLDALEKEFRSAVAILNRDKAQAISNFEVIKDFRDETEKRLDKLEGASGDDGIKKLGQRVDKIEATLGKMKK